MGRQRVSHEVKPQRYSARDIYALTLFISLRAADAKHLPDPRYAACRMPCRAVPCKKKAELRLGGLHMKKASSQRRAKQKKTYPVRQNIDRACVSYAACAPLHRHRCSGGAEGKSCSGAVGEARQPAQFPSLQLQRSIPARTS